MKTLMKVAPPKRPFFVEAMVCLKRVSKLTYIYIYIRGSS